MTTLNRTLTFVRRALAVSAFVGAGLAVAHAQQTETPVPAQTLNLSAPVVDSARDVTFSSSNSENEVAVANNHFDFLNANTTAAQPGGRYGRPRYRGGNTNPDGSAKYDFYVGAGFVQPVGNTYHYLTPNYGIQVGGGRQFSKAFAMNVQFDYDDFGFNGRTISTQSLIYFGQTGEGLDGNSHVWSFTLDPRFTLMPGDNGLGAYVVGGVGFYHKTANFTVPATGTYCDYFGYCYEYEANQTIDKYTSNAPGFNGGFGLTYKISRFSNEKFYAEARYVYVANQQRAGYNLNNINSAPASATNFYPANSNRTTYIPVKFGIRF